MAKLPAGIEIIRAAKMQMTRQLEIGNINFNMTRHRFSRFPNNPLSFVTDN